MKKEFAVYCKGKKQSNSDGIPKDCIISRFLSPWWPVVLLVQLSELKFTVGNICFNSQDTALQGSSFTSVSFKFCCGPC